jgi:hypothetical protein
MKKKKKLITRTKNLHPWFKDQEAQAFGYWLFKSLEQGNNDQESDITPK